MLGLAAFLIVVAVFLTLGTRAGTRTLGLVTLVVAAYHLRAGKISYGWEGRESSGYITGVPAILLACLIGLLGLAMLIEPGLMMALLGWH